MGFSHHGRDKAYRGGYKPPHGGQNGSRGGSGPKAKLCGNMQRDGFCRFGDSCRYIHDQGGSSHGSVVKTTDREQRGQPGERTRAMDKYLHWRRLIKRPPVPHDFATMKLLWTEALGFLDESDREVLHMLPRDLDNEQYCGRQHIQSLLAIEKVPLHCGSMLELVLPFLQLITHHSLLSCLSVDTYIGALYNFIGGTNGSRALPFLHRCITSLIQSDSVDDGTDSTLAVKTNIMPIVRALRELLIREHRVLFNDDVPPLADLIEVAGTVLCEDADAVVLQILATNVQDIRSMVARSNGLLFHAEAQEEASGSAKGRAISTYPRELVLPSGRHDNDRLDISDIKILPTTEEIRSDHEEFLPSTNPDQPHYLCDPSQRHLDTHFRLLRHDIFGELKETLGGLMAAVDASPALLADTNLTLGNIRAYTYPCSRINYISFDNKRGLEARVSFPQLLQLRKRSPSERRTWWEASKRLEEGGLLCVLFLDEGKSSSLLLTVSDKCADTKKNFTLSSNAFYATISAKLAATSQDDVTKMAWLSRNKIQCMLIELPGVLVATFIPILENLQNMQRSSRLPFRQWLLPRVENDQGVQHVPAPIYAKATSFSFGLKPILKDDGEDILVTSRTSVSDRSVIAEIERRTGLDSGQSSALVAALTREYALIQGPPGTGKSYLGVQLMRVLLAQKDVARLGPVVVVCYTNHALDQFLEHLIAVGIQKVIRIGGQSKSSVLEGKNLRVVAREESKTKSEGALLGKTYQKIEDDEESITRTLREIHKSKDQRDWANLRSYIRQVHSNIHSQFQRTDEQGFEKVGSHPFDVWRKGKSIEADPSLLHQGGIEDMLVVADRNVHSIASHQRHYLVDHWAEQAFKEQVDGLLESVKQYDSHRRLLNDVHDEIDRRVLQTADVIGVTTTGLARRIAVLQKVHSKVTICEEAGEVLEAHMISALLPSVQHFIQIGDHQQLRPEINNHKLSLEGPHKTKYQLDRSQFERLALDKNGVFPIARLSVQRRMRPEVSTLIQKTIYPGLINHEVTQNLPHVIGMRKDVFWLDHDNMEDTADADSQQKTRANGWEVDMVHALIRHIVRQGAYKSDEIAVLTPYAGQLQRLRAKLRIDFEVVVSERDQEELAKGGFDTESSPGAKDEEGEMFVPSTSKPLEKKPLSELLRVATVDNFQGEEAKIVIVSLVRSNKANKVGFLKTTNRINVLLSRAQHGLYLIGNVDTYCNVPMWNTVVGMLRTMDSVGKALSLYCPRHTDTITEVSQPDDFARLSPEGGCQLVCDRRLDACGHQCQARCHSASMHEVFSCQQPCRRLHSPCGHVCQKPTCGEPCGSCMIRVDGVMLPCNHKKDKVPCHQTQDLTRVTCHTLVQKRAPRCEHVVEMLCPTDVNSARFSCPITCDEILSCGHQCTGTCGRCGTDNNGGQPRHQQCMKICGRKFATCSHACKKRCHDGTDCGQCESRCEVRCAHSQCDKKCHEPCAPCVENCAWSCEHQGRCSLPCGAPCDRLPCDERCTKIMACGHRCPSLCGENCPEGYCQACNTKQDSCVDLLEMKLYREIDLDEDPIIVLGCGHFFTTETLDGHVGMGEVYVQGTRGFTGLQDFSAVLAREIPRCPYCQCPIRQHVTRRLNRTINRAVIDEMSKRFIVMGQSKLRDLEEDMEALEAVLGASRQGLLHTIRQGRAATSRLSQADCIASIQTQLAERYNQGRKVEKSITSFLETASEEFQPAKKLHDAVQTANKTSPLDRSMAHQSFTDVSSGISRDRRVALGGRAAKLKTQYIVLTDKFTIFRELAVRPITAEIKMPGGAVNLAARPFFQECSAFFDACVVDSLPKLAVEASIYYANVTRVYQTSAGLFPAPKGGASSPSYPDVARRLLHRAKELCSNPFQNVTVLYEAVCELANVLEGERYEDVTEEEIAAIKAAMISGRGGFATHSGHWYNCENGHPFAIGECGMPMERARCPECGAPVGGQNHQVVNGVSRATQME